QGGRFGQRPVATEQVIQLVVRYIAAGDRDFAADALERAARGKYRAVETVARPSQAQFVRFDRRTFQRNEVFRHLGAGIARLDSYAFVVEADVQPVVFRERNSPEHAGADRLGVVRRRIELAGVY